VSLCGAYSKIALRPPSQKQVKCELYMPTSEDRYSQGLIYLMDILRSLTAHVDAQYEHLRQTRAPEIYR
jgi:hypothetical protein